MSTSARELILKSVRQHLPESSPLPDLDGPWITFPDPLAQFRSVLEMIGGRCLQVPTVADIPAALAGIPAYAESRQVYVGLPNQDWGTVRDRDLPSPHALADLDFAVLPGEFAVAENAAVWVQSAQLTHRVAYFICQHLALVVPVADIVNNLSEAYRRIRIDGPGFQGFIAGPSKTADIEQSLVIGAHGPRSMTVIFVG